MRALFFPSYVGGGFGHISRCLALGEEMTRRGWKTTFVLGGPHRDRLSAAGWSILSPPPRSLPSRLWRRLRGVLRWLRPSPAYLFFSDINYQVVRDGFSSPHAVERRVEWELNVVNRLDPDVLIGDTWLLTSIVGQLANVPVVQIVRAGTHPRCGRLVWWRSPPSQVVSPQIGPVFNPALERWGLPAVKQASELLKGELYLVPSIPRLDPLPSRIERTHYVGPLVRLIDDHDALPEELSTLSVDRPVVYVTVGGGANAVRGLDLLSLWEAVFAEAGWEVVISTAGQPVPAHWCEHSRLKALPWIPGTAMIARADAVLFHGGYGTMMETVRAGVPSVVLPFHTEQESNGRRLQESGAGRVLAPADDKLTPLKLRWRAQDFTVLAARRLLFRPPEILEAVREILADGRYRAGAESLQRSQADYGGAARAVDLVTDLAIP